MMRALFLFLTVLFLQGCRIHMDNSIADRNRRVEDYLGGTIRNGKFPGLQYVVVDSTSVLLRYFGGWADVQNRIRMDSTTTMMAYSMTKTFTAAAVLQLIESGQVGLDTPVDTYFPSTPYGHTMTVRHLLSQTSGIPNPIPLRWAHPAGRHAAFDEDSALGAVLRKNPKLRFPPGSKYAYSNISYWILGKIVEHVSGRPFPTYMEEHIFTPLHLQNKDAAFTISPGVPHAKGYLKKYSLMNLAKALLIDRELIGEYEEGWLHINDHHLNGPGFGGLIATAPAVAAFLQDQLREHSVLLGNGTKSLFFSRQAATSGELIDMTLGWHIGHLDGVPYYFKEGGGGGYHAEMRIYPDRRIGTVIMVNETSSACTDVQSEADRDFIF